MSGADDGDSFAETGRTEPMTQDVILARLDAAIEAAAVAERVAAKGLDDERFTIEDYPIHVWEDEGGAIVEAA